MPPRFKQNQRGVTLIELMIAISLVAILVAGLFSAMRAGLLTYEKTGQRLEANRRAMSVQQILSNQLENAVPVAGLCPSSDSEKPSGLLPFFLGTDTWLRMATTYSMAEGARGAPRIVEYQAQPLTGGGFRLAMAERPFINSASTAAYCNDLQQHPVDLGASPVVLVDRLAICGFAYHVPYNVYNYQELPWVALWDAHYPQLPAAVRIEMKSAVPAVAGLPVVSFTIPIRSDRNPLAQIYDGF